MGGKNIMELIQTEKAFINKMVMEKEFEFLKKDGESLCFRRFSEKKLKYYWDRFNPTPCKCCGKIRYKRSRCPSKLCANCSNRGLTVWKY